MKSQCHTAVHLQTALITYKALKTGQPVYLRDLLHYHQPARTLRSSSQILLYQPAARINFQSKAFSITAPTVWNSLSSSTKSFTTISTFKVHLKTELFAATLLHTTQSSLTFLLPPAPRFELSTYGADYKCF